ncbi:unnamed protein product [Orchesella dallaii]|uniref:F-box domain-containing protein n=1 Tax=Orchesella dallaii TaxID=48710 RepID=A0ABP1S7U0_9HEXA
MWKKRLEVKEEKKSVVVFQSPNSNPRLPSECWLQILGYVSGDTEVLALVTSCLEFSDMLKERKTTHLLPFVIPLIIKSEYLSRQDILRCRLITKSTKNAVGNELKPYFTSPTYAFYPSSYYPYLYSMYRGPASLKEIHSINHCNIFKKEEDAHKLYNHYNNKIMNEQCNPFVTRNIEIHLGDNVLLSADDQRDNEPFATFQRMLNPNYGYSPQVAGITFVLFNDRNFDGFFLFAKIVALLREVRDIELLRVRAGFMRPVERRRSLYFPYQTGPNAVAAELIRETYNFPPLPKLIFLDLTLDWMLLPKKVANSLFTHYGKQLEVLKCDGNFLVNAAKDAEGEDQPLRRLLPNVKKLHLCHVDNTFTTLWGEEGWELELLEFYNGWLEVPWHHYFTLCFHKFPKLQKVVAWKEVGSGIGKESCTVITRDMVMGYQRSRNWW